jgi:hypothetical protein
MIIRMITKMIAKMVARTKHLTMPTAVQKTVLLKLAQKAKTVTNSNLENSEKECLGTLFLVMGNT